MRTIRAAAVVLVLGTVAISAIAVQDKPETRLTLGFDNQTPGMEVAVALLLEVPPGVQVGATISEVRFSNKLLSFRETRKGTSATASGADLTAVLSVEDQTPDYSVVKITVSSKGERALETGVLADLVFKIADNAPTGQSAALKHEARAFTRSDPANPIAPFTAEDGEIQITESSPIIACFFYMH